MKKKKTHYLVRCGDKTTIPALRRLSQEDQEFEASLDALGCPQTAILPVSTSTVASITGLIHHAGLLMRVLLGHFCNRRGN
jgi:hypothetical protein